MSSSSWPKESELNDIFGGYLSRAVSSRIFIYLHFFNFTGPLWIYYHFWFCVLKGCLCLKMCLSVRPYVFLVFAFFFVSFSSFLFLCYFIIIL